MGKLAFIHKDKLMIYIWPVTTRLLHMSYISCLIRWLTHKADLVREEFNINSHLCLLLKLNEKFMGEELHTMLLLYLKINIMS